MSFADPQSVTINGVATSLPRVSSGTDSGKFQTSDGLVVMSISSSYGKRIRRAVRLAQTKSSTDPIVPAQNLVASMSATLVVDVPLLGYTITEEKYIVDALTAWATASSGAKITQLLGGEN